MRTAVKARVTRQGLAGDYMASFTSAYGKPVTTFFRSEQADEHTNCKTLVYCTVLARFKRFSHVRFGNGDHAHVAHDLLQEVA